MFANENPAGAVLLDLYRGVQDDDSWFRALDLIGESLRGAALFLGSVSAGGDFGMTVRGIESHCGALLSGPFATPEANPFIRPMMTMPKCRSHLTPAVCGDQALVRSMVFQHALKPYHQRYVVGAILEPTGNTVRTVAFSREAREGDFSEAEAEYLDTLLPHLSRAAGLRADFAELRQQSSAALAALNDVERGIVILDGNFQIAFANVEARRIFELDDGLRARNSNLLVSDRRAAELLRNGLRPIAHADFMAEPSSALRLSVPRKSGGLPFVMSVSSAPGLLPSERDTRVPSIIVTIVDPERTCSPSTGLLREIYGLTPVEAQLAGALCDFDLHDAADELGISINTAKTHLKAIFQKVGVSRQSALVRLVTLHSAF